MINDFTSMIAALKAEALLVQDVGYSLHLGSGDNIKNRIQKYYEGQFKATHKIALFIDSSEAQIEDDGNSNVRISFDLGFATIAKGDLKNHADIDVTWNDTLNALIAFIGRVKHLQEELEDEFEIDVSLKMSQVGKIANADVYGWRSEAKITFPANHLYCTHL
jgi:hypothetical protein